MIEPTTSTHIAAGLIDERSLQRAVGSQAAVDSQWDLLQSRYYSQFLSLQLKARYEGLPTPVYGQAPVHHLR